MSPPGSARSGFREYMFSIVAATVTGTWELRR
jgi:hypothetical protein